MTIGEKCSITIETINFRKTLILCVSFLLFFIVFVDGCFDSIAVNGIFLALPEYDPEISRCKKTLTEVSVLISPDMPFHPLNIWQSDKPKKQEFFRQGF
jgi:hypothetical protein